jgi:hypothetical protein
MPRQLGNLFGLHSLRDNPDDEYEISGFLSGLDKLMAINSAPCGDIMHRTGIRTIDL